MAERCASVTSWIVSRQGQAGFPTNFVCLVRWTSQRRARTEDGALLSLTPVGSQLVDAVRTILPGELHEHRVRDPPDGEARRATKSGFRGRNGLRGLVQPRWQRSWSRSTESKPQKSDRQRTMRRRISPCRSHPGSREKGGVPAQLASSPADHPFPLAAGARERFPRRWPS